MLFVYLSGVYTEQSSSSFFIIFMFHFFFQALIEWGFWYFIRMKRERKVIERGRGWFFCHKKKSGSSCVCGKL